MIRLAKQEDINEMLLLLQQLFDIEKDFQFDAPRQKNALKLLLNSSTSAIFVATVKERVIGMGTVQLVISTSEGRLSMLVEDVVVKPSWQNHGIASELLQSLGDWGAIRGAKRMQLLADQTNSPALSFYHRRGWQQTQLICLRKFHSERNGI